MALLVGGGLLYFQLTLPETDKLRTDINHRLLRLESINSTVSELVLRSRAYPDHGYEELDIATAELSDALESLEKIYIEDTDKQTLDTALARRFEALKEELNNKIVIVNKFKSHNSTLRKSLNRVLMAGRSVVVAYEELGLLLTAKHYTNISNSRRVGLGSQYP